MEGPPTPILYSDDEDFQEMSSEDDFSEDITSEDENVQETNPQDDFPEDPACIDECYEPYDQTDDYEDEREGCAFVQLAITAIEEANMDEIRKLVERSDYRLVWEHAKVLCNPIEKGNVALVRFLVESCPDRERYLQDGDYFTGPGAERERMPIVDAISHGNLEVFETLIELGVRIDHPRYQDAPLQQLAIWGGNVRIMECLHRMGYYPMIDYLFRMTSDNVEILEFVIENSRIEESSSGRTTFPKRDLIEYFKERGMEDCLEFISGR